MNRMDIECLAHIVFVNKSRDVARYLDDLLRIYYADGLEDFHKDQFRAVCETRFLQNCVNALQTST
jgi:hypothetical protein